MLYIFHGDDQYQSRKAFIQYLDSKKTLEILRLDSKEIDLEKIINFLQSSSLFGKDRLLALNNYFSLNKNLLDKVTDILLTESKHLDIVIWQDKTLTASQLNKFSQAKISSFRINNSVFQCVYSVKPKNLKQFLPLFKKIIQDNLYDLFLYLIKSSLRKQLTSYSRFEIQKLINTYIQLIELDFQNKTGQLTIPKEIALEKIMVDLME